jgi:hypothetical protein
MAWTIVIELSLTLFASMASFLVHDVLAVG